MTPASGRRISTRVAHLRGQAGVTRRTGAGVSVDLRSSASPAYTALALRSDSIWPAVLAHGYYDLAAFLLN